jgi:hypothetical protein
MERLIQLLDELDDLISPAFVVLTEQDWLRGVALVALVLAIHGIGASWMLATMVSLPAFPLGDLALAHARQLRPQRLPLLARSVGGS